VDSAEEGSIGHDSSEVIIGLIQKSMPIISRERDLFRGSLLVPAEFATRFWVKVLDLVLDGVVSGARELLIQRGYLVLLFWSISQLRIV
jgi:hypothetical protein